MNKLHLVACAMLIASTGTLATQAGAAPTFPHHLAAGPDHYQLVQYGGGDGDDDDGPRRGGGYSQPRGGGYTQPRGGNGGAIIEQLLENGIKAIEREAAKKRQQQNQQNQQYQQNQQNQRRAIEDRERANKLRQERELSNRLKQEQEKQKALQLQKLRAQEEQNKLLQDQVKQAQVKKNQLDAIKKEDEAQQQRNQAARSGNGPYQNDDEEKVADQLENGTDIQRTVYPIDDKPPLDQIPSLHVDKNTELPAGGYVNLPPDRDLCSGRTASGCWLRIVSIPTTGGDRRSVCLAYCRVRPNVTPRVVVVPRPVVPPYVPPAVPVAPSYVAPPYVPPAVPVAPPYVAPPRPTTPAVLTVKAGPYVEPPPRRPPPVPAVLTVKAGPYVEPPPRRPPPVPAVLTVKAGPYVEPEPKRPAPVPAVLTAKAGPYVEPEPKRPAPVPAVLTAKAGPYVEPEPRHPPVTPPRKTVTANPYIEPASNRPRITPAVLTVRAHPYTQPGPKGPDAKPDEPAFELDSMEPPATQPEPIDAKGCTASGVKPLNAAIAGPLAKFNSPAFAPREVVTTMISGIPKVGGLISGVTKMFWKDDSKEKLFDAMKSYVDQAVPAAIAKYDTTQLNNDLTVTRNLLNWYDSTRTPSTKGQKLSELVTQLEQMKPRFLNPQSPRSTLAEFVAFGTLHLSTLKELYDHYDQYYPFDAKDANAAKDHQTDRGVVQSKLNDAIKDYKDHIPVLRDDIIADRLSKLRVNDRGEVHTEFFSVDADFIMVPNDYFSAKDDFCDWQGAEAKDNRGAAQADVDRRKAAVTAAYNKLIDELTRPIAQWKPIPIAAPPLGYRRF